MTTITQAEAAMDAARKVFYAEQTQEAFDAMQEAEKVYFDLLKQGEKAVTK